MRVVIVEDESRARNLIRTLLQTIDPHIMIVGECVDAEDGMHVIQRMHPDLVFADIRMPGMDGLEMIEKLCSKVAQVEYVLVSGYSDFRYARKGIDLKVLSYILKPVTYEDVEEALQKYRLLHKNINLDPVEEKKLPLYRLRELENDCQNLVVRKAIHYVGERVGQPCRLSETANALSVSPEHLSRLFHEEMDMTFTDYVKLVKIDYSMVLLSKTAMKIQEISWAVGIKNEKYFSTLFRETVGMNPRQFREESGLKVEI